MNGWVGPKSYRSYAGSQSTSTGHSSDTGLAGSRQGPTGPYIPRPADRPGRGVTTEFSPAEQETLRAVCDALIPGASVPGPSAAFYARGASALAVDRAVADIVERQFTPNRAARFHDLLRTLDSPGRNLLLTGRPVRFSRLSPEGRVAYLKGWRDSALPVKRAGFQALKRLSAFVFYSIPGSTGPNPNWEAIGYPGVLPEPVPVPPSEPGLVPVDPAGEVELSVDVCVVGAGAGGSVAASELSAAGLGVVVLEAGEYTPASAVVPSEYAMTARSFEAGGTLATDDLAFQLLAGRGAGGGTSVNWMACLRPPPAILRRWEAEFGLAGLTGPEFAQDVEAVWAALEVNGRESQRNPNNDALWRGAVALGYREGRDYRPLPRNAVGCRQRCDFCGFGCPYGAKRSTALTFLPRAAAHGARLFFRTSVSALELDGGRIRAVRAEYRRADGRRVPVRVRCRAVALGAGAIHTPAILRRSGLTAAPIGSGLRLHPTTVVLGEFADEVRPWAGPPQTVAITRFLDAEETGRGFWIEAAPAHPGLAALSIPWTDGVAHKRWMAERYRRSTASIVLLSERSHGSVSVGPDGAPRVGYRMNREDRAELTQGVLETGRVLAAAGARGLATLHTDPVDVRSEHERLSDEEFARFVAGVSARGIRPHRVMLASAHLMGSCPMGPDGGRAAVRPTGELWSAENVYVVDASVFPTSPAVNPMVTIMAMARRTSRAIVGRLRSPPG